MSEVAIREYTPSDLPQLLRIYEKVWGKESAEHIAKIWSWKYHEHPYLKDGRFPSLVGEKDGSIVGFLGAFPAMFKIGEKEYESFWLADFMVDSDHRGSVGVRLAQEIMARHPTLFGIGGTGSTRMAGSYRIWMRLKKKTKKDVTIIESQLKRLSIERFVCRKLKSKLLASIADRLWRFLVSLRCRSWSRSIKPNMEIEQIERFTDEHKPFLKELMEQVKNISIREPEMLNWRFFSRPDTKHTVLIAKRDKKPVGYIVLRLVKYHGELHGRIVDIMAKKEDRECFKLLLMSAEKIFLDNKVVIVRAYAAPAFSKEELKLAGFSTNRIKDPYYPVLGESPDKNAFNQNDWHISLADADVDMD